METRCTHPKLDDVMSGFVQRKEQPSVTDLDQVIVSVSQNDTLVPWHTQLAQCACGQPAYPRYQLVGAAHAGVSLVAGWNIDNETFKSEGPNFAFLYLLGLTIKICSKSLRAWWVPRASVLRLASCFRLSFPPFPCGRSVRVLRPRGKQSVENRRGPCLVGLYLGFN